MELFDKLNEIVFCEPECVIALTGGGGKTTTLIALGQYYRSKGLSVLLSTTTKMQSPLYHDFKVDHVFTDESDFFMHDVKKGESVLYIQEHIMNRKKCISPRDEVLPIMSKRFDVSIFEADGARTLPLKKHRECDPVIPANVTSIIALAGMSSLHKSAADYCMGEAFDFVVDNQYLQDLIDNEEGLLKGVTDKHKAAIFLNQSDLLSKEDRAILKGLKAPCLIVLGSTLNNEVY
jgi:probable selenium-dependent hydroxylase accessory protein YqeC